MIACNELSEMLLCAKLNKINENSITPRTLDFAILHHIFITDWMKSLTPKEGLKFGSCGSCTITLRSLCSLFKNGKVGFLMYLEST
jgi:hypothetical protein